MSKVVDWNKTYRPAVGDITRGNNSKNTSASMKESFKKSYSQLMEQEQAEEALKKAMPVMKGILLQRMTEKRPLKVMRPLPYTTESLGGDEEDDGFYNNVVKGANASFKSITKVIPPGTELTFLTLEKSMNQLWFRTDKGEEIGIYLEEQNRLLTQTDIYEVVAKAMKE
jgi:hypothetical protein